MTEQDRRNDAGDDRLERRSLAAKVAALIASYRGRESLVIGIEGPWGAGKTAFTALVLKEIEAGQSAAVVTFNPWNLSEQSELVAEFFSELARVLEAAAANVAESRTVHGPGLRTTARRSLAVSSRASAGSARVLRGSVSTPHDQRGDIREKLGNLQDRIVVVMEDIDRLDHDQTRLVMKLVRMASGLPNIVFLLAYDRARVAASVEEDARPGDDYLKTIVQLAFTLPEPSRHELNSLLFAQLRETVSRVYGEARYADDDARWRELVDAGLPALFRTTADIEGFVTSLRLSWSMVGTDEVNMADFIGIEAIRVFAPHLYAAIGTHRSLFTRLEAAAPLGNADQAVERQARYEDVLLAAPEALRPMLDRICRHLFPSLGVEAYADGWREEWRAQKRVADEERFAVYFQLGILEPTVSETEVLFLRRRLNSNDAITGLLREYLLDGRLGVLLARLPSKSSLISESDAKALLLGLWALEDQIGDGARSPFDPDGVPAIAVRLARNLIRDAVANERRAHFLDELVSETAAVSYPLALISALEQQIDKTGQGAEQPLLAQVDLEAPKARLQERMGLKN